MGKVLAARAFLTDTPAEVMQLLVQDVADSKEQMILRAVCDERISVRWRASSSSQRCTRPSWTALEARGPGGGEGQLALQHEAVVGRRSPDSVAPSIYRKLGYTNDMIKLMGLDPSAIGCRTGADGPDIRPRGGEGDEGIVYPRITADNVHGVVGKDYRKKNYPVEMKHVFWAHMECGLVLSSVTPWELIPKTGARELEEFGHLFGDARFRTIRAHCLAYEGMRKIGLQNLPWTAGDVQHLMNQAVTLEVTPAKLQKWWGTLKWLSNRLGMLNVDEHKQLLEKRKAIQETLVDTQVKPQRKAVVPTRAIVWALEQGAEGTPPENRVPELTKAVDRYITAMATPAVRASTTCSTPRRRRSSPRATPWSCWPGKRRPRAPLLLGGQMVDPLGAVVEEIQGLGGVPQNGLPDPHDQQGQDGLHPPPRNPRQVPEVAQRRLGEAGRASQGRS